jgi:hypothetical protein
MEHSKTEPSLLVPSEEVRLSAGDTRLTIFTFPGGSKATILGGGEYSDDILIVSDGGSVVEAVPEVDNAPFSTKVAELALAFYDEYGHFPNALSGK